MKEFRNRLLKSLDVRKKNHRLVGVGGGMELATNVTAALSHQQLVMKPRHTMEDVTPREYFDTVMSVRQKMRRLRDPPTGEDVLNQMMAACASRDNCYHPTPKSEVEEREVMETRYQDQPEVLRTETDVSEEEEEELEEKQPLLLEKPNLDQNGQPLYQTLASQVHMSSFVSSEEEEGEEEEEEEEEPHHWMENAHQLLSTSMAAPMGQRRPVVHSDTTTTTEDEEELQSIWREVAPERAGVTTTQDGTLILNQITTRTTSRRHRRKRSLQGRISPAVYMVHELLSSDENENLLQNRPLSERRRRITLKRLYQPSCAREQL